MDAFGYGNAQPTLTVEQHDALGRVCFEVALALCRGAGYPFTWWPGFMGGENFVEGVARGIESLSGNFSENDKALMHERFREDYDKSVDKKTHRAIDIPKHWMYCYSQDGNIDDTMFGGIRR